MKFFNLLLVSVVLFTSCKKEVVSKTTPTSTPKPKVIDSTNVNTSSSNEKDSISIYRVGFYINTYPLNSDTILKGKLVKGKKINNIELFFEFNYNGKGVILPQKTIDCITIPGIQLIFNKLDTLKNNGKLFYTLSGTPSNSGLAKFKININNEYGRTAYSSSLNEEYKIIDLNVNGYSDPLVDIEGNIYKTVWIGKQLWMAENLKTTKYNDGTPVPLNQNGLSSWYNVYPGYCFYNNDEKNKNIYGTLYQWGVVEKQKVCPTGWKVPSDYDFYTLTGYLENDDFLAEKLKETLTWKKSAYFNTTNWSLFSALAAGSRGEGFAELGISTGFWSSSRGKILNTTNPKAFTMYYNTGYFSGGVNNPDEYFFYVRCVKNQPNN